jgi:hypothetical protein
MIEAAGDVAIVLTGQQDFESHDRADQPAPTGSPSVGFCDQGAP